MTTPFEQDPNAVQLSDEQIAEVRFRLNQPAVYATDEEIAAIAEGRRAFTRGEYITLDELEADLNGKT